MSQSTSTHSEAPSLRHGEFWLQLFVGGWLMTRAQITALCIHKKIDQEKYEEDPVVALNTWFEEHNTQTDLILEPISTFGYEPKIDGEETWLLIKGVAVSFSHTEEYKAQETAMMPTGKWEIYWNDTVPEGCREEHRAVFKRVPVFLENRWPNIASTRLPSRVYAKVHEACHKHWQKTGEISAGRPEYGQYLIADIDISETKILKDDDANGSKGIDGRPHEDGIFFYGDFIIARALERTQGVVDLSGSLNFGGSRAED